jgi:ATP-dependent helicase/nuclease subunit A
VTEADRDRLADAEARRAAQRDVARSIVLEAGAGTGKTTVLIARVLGWCLGEGWTRVAERLAPDATLERIAEQVLARVVAITFTEAAAAEMESRAIAALRHVAQGKEVVGFDPALVAAGVAEQTARAKALSSAADHLRFQTIHAFCRRLLAAHAIAAGLHPRFTVDATGDERAAVVRETLEARLRDVAASGDADLEALLQDGVGAPELERMLLALADSGVRASAFETDPLAPTRVADWAASLRRGFEAFESVAGGRLARGSPKSILVADAVARSLALLAEPLRGEAGVTRLIGALQENWPKPLRDRLRELGKHQLKAKADREAISAEQLPKLAAAARASLAQVRAVDDLDPALLARVHRVVAPLFVAVEARLAERGAICFDALLGRTRDLLVARPEIAAAVRAEIDQLLVDEFQDTDAVQCEIVAVLALDGPRAARPVLFVVGDPKQSIYGFRNADVAAYLRFVERVCRDGGAEKHVLAVSHRSVPDLLAEVERIVAPAMVEASGVQPPFQRLVANDENASVRGSGDARIAAVEYWCSDGWDDAAGAFGSGVVADALALEARAVAADLVRLHDEARVPWKESAILLRAMGDVDRYLAALRDAGVPYRVDRDRDFRQRREIRDATALVCAVLDPNDQIALVATLRSAWVGVPDAAWRPLWAHGFPAAARAAIEGDRDALARVVAMASEAAGAAAGVPGVAALAGWDRSLVHAIEVLSSLRATYATETSDTFVEALRVRTLVEATEAARHPGAFRVANLARFFRELATALDAHAGDVAAILRALRGAEANRTEIHQGRAAASDDDAVAVMTIHGAKGLDFGHVYVVQTHKQSRKHARAFAHAASHEGLQWRLAGGRAAISTFGWSEAEAARDRVDAAERVRTLYVAATRAKRRVVWAGRFETAKPEEATHAGAVRDALGAALDDARAEMLATRSGRAYVAAACGAREAPVIRWLALDETPEAAPRGAERAAAIDVAAVESASAKLAELDADARARMDRERVGRASAHAAQLRRDARGDRWEPDSAAEERIEAERSVAAAVGTAVHALLEHYDWSASDDDTEWSRRVDQARAAIDHTVPSAHRAAAQARAGAILEVLHDGPLFARLAALAPHTIARELAFAAPALPGDGGATAAHVGAIDWIYLDPDAHEVVVVDFKTDRVATPEDVAARVERHHAQAARYANATRQALGLESLPRVELWFLAASRREVVTIPAS